MIARALARRPRILVLDEPTVGIDIAGQRRFADMLDALHRELGLTLVIVSHELRTIVTASDRIACLARTMHFHGSASGLTPAILEQVFRHDVSGIVGPGAALGHAPCVHGHGGGCCEDH
jgi:zinc transport system ATP-binding protein